MIYNNKQSLTVKTEAAFLFKVDFDSDLVKVGYYGSQRQLLWLVASPHRLREVKESGEGLG